MSLDPFTLFDDGGRLPKYASVPVIEICRRERAMFLKLVNGLETLVVRNVSRMCGQVTGSHQDVEQRAFTLITRQVFGVVIWFCSQGGAVASLFAKGCAMGCVADRNAR